VVPLHGRISRSMCSWVNSATVGVRFSLERMACCMISKDWPLASRSLVRVSASTIVATVSPWLDRVFGSRQRTIKDLDPSFLVRVLMLAIEKRYARVHTFGGFVHTQPPNSPLDLWKHCARDGTRTVFQALQTPGTRENTGNPKQSGGFTGYSEARSVDIVHTPFPRADAWERHLWITLQGHPTSPVVNRRCR
jgi:hypothetical protein